MVSGTEDRKKSLGMESFYKKHWKVNSDHSGVESLIYRWDHWLSVMVRFLLKELYAHKEKVNSAGTQEIGYFDKRETR